MGGQKTLYGTFYRLEYVMNLLWYLVTNIISKINCHIKFKIDFISIIYQDNQLRARKIVIYIDFYVTYLLF